MNYELTWTENQKNIKTESQNDQKTRTGFRRHPDHLLLTKMNHQDGKREVGEEAGKMTEI